MEESRQDANPSKKQLWVFWGILVATVVLIDVAMKALPPSPEEQEKERKEYVATRTRDCLAVYKVEQASKSNVVHFEFDPLLDGCRVYYKDATEWQGKDCNKLTPARAAGTPEYMLVTDARLKKMCQQGLSEQIF